MKFSKLLCLLLTALLTLSRTNAQVNVQDSLALVDLYDSTNGPEWSDPTVWKNGPVTTWDGVSVTGSRVTGLNLALKQISGSIPASFGNLTSLQALDLYGNQISSLPASFGNLINLQELILMNNKLSSLPASFGSLMNLQYITLANNQLGSLPASFGNLVNLWFLDLRNNHLQSLPDYIGNLVNVDYLSLGGNQLSTLPTTLGNLIKLNRLEVNNNQLSSLPASIGNLANLFQLSLSFNQLSSLPASIWNLNKLDYLGINNNKFTFATMEWVVLTHANTIQYTPQDSFKLLRVDNTLIAPVGGTPENNTFYWYLDDQLIATIKADSTYTPTKAGTYRVEAHNAIATQLILYSKAVTYGPDCKEAPAITIVSATPSVLWPPNHKMIDVTVNYSVGDNCDGSTAMLSVTSNDGSTSSDWEVLDAHHVRLRAERSGSGNGRTYTTTITVTDAAGNKSTKTVNVVVPHDMSGKNKEKNKGDLKVKVLPNPSQHDFTLQVQSSSDKRLSVRVTNAVGKIIEVKQNIGAKGTLHLGASYAPGTYYAEVLQVGSRSVVKLVKLPR